MSDPFWALIQSAHLFTAIVNHEVMGYWSIEDALRKQFNDPAPRAIASQRYQNQSVTIQSGSPINRSTPSLTKKPSSYPKIKVTILDTMR